MSSSPTMPTPSESAIRLLREIVREAGDGYTLMYRTGLKCDEFEKAVRELLRYALVEVKGDTSSERLGESYFYVPLTAQGRAEFLLGRLGTLSPPMW
jgi:hypothetical protein